MSTYIKEKVLRIPVEKLHLRKMYNKFTKEEIENDWYWCVEKTYERYFDYGITNKFQIAPTKKDFIDYVLCYNSDSNGEYGKIRTLYPEEKNKYHKIFSIIDPSVNMDDVHLVEFCWYNATEAPDYYDDTQDDFYKPI